MTDKSQNFPVTLHLPHILLVSSSCFLYVVTVFIEKMCSPSVTLNKARFCSLEMIDLQLQLCGQGYAGLAISNGTKSQVMSKSKPVFVHVLVYAMLTYVL